MNNLKLLNVYCADEEVGTLATTNDHVVAFEYDDRWLLNGFSISPFSLPLKKQVFVPKYDPFDGVFGVFADSLPDDWGKLIVDRILIREGLNPRTVNSLNRLAIVGACGMGALSYRPAHDLVINHVHDNFDLIATKCRQLIENHQSEDLDELFVLGGSSGGARPKALVRIDGEDWIVKFPSSYDPVNIGELEFKYSQCAKSCGVDMATTKLLPSRQCSGYFGTRRFDRKMLPDNTLSKMHVVSAGGILETSHRIPNLDYTDLMKLTYMLTKDYREVEKLFRLMCFNVFSHNRDDHSKNFSYCYDRSLKLWKLSPAYDLTYSSSLGGEHATSVFGNGKAPGVADIVEVAKSVDMDHRKARRIAISIQEKVHAELGPLIRSMT